MTQIKCITILFSHTSYKKETKKEKINLLRTNVSKHFTCAWIVRLPYWNYSRSTALDELHVWSSDITFIRIYFFRINENLLRKHANDRLVIGGIRLEQTLFFRNAGHFEQRRLEAWINVKKLMIFSFKNYTILKLLMKSRADTKMQPKFSRRINTHIDFLYVNAEKKLII